MPLVLTGIASGLRSMLSGVPGKVDILVQNNICIECLVCIISIPTDIEL